MFNLHQSVVIRIDGLLKSNGTKGGVLSDRKLGCTPGVGKNSSTGSVSADEVPKVFCVLVIAKWNIFFSNVLFQNFQTFERNEKDPILPN